MLNYALVGKRIKEIRQLKGLSQARLAELDDLSVSYISYIENGRKKASLRSLVNIAKAMCTTLDALLNGNQSNSKGDYHDEITILFEGCSNYEKRILYEQILSLKTSLRNNYHLFAPVYSSSDF